MSEPSKIFESMVLGKRVRHSGHKVLRWNVENVAVKEDKKENIYPYKRSKKKRIDGVTGSIIGLKVTMGYTPTGSLYETEDLFVLGV